MGDCLLDRHQLLLWFMRTRLIPRYIKLEQYFFLKYFCIFYLACTTRRLSSIPLYASSYPGRLASRNSPQFFSTELFFITTLHGPLRKHSLSIAGKACLLRRCIATEVTLLLLADSLPQECFYCLCLTMKVYSDFAIPAFGCHVTIIIINAFYNKVACPSI
jgi:hypothetical protein